ncbi:MAG: UDP-3-O-(3-hydroxymyristoyl)glucosamine N-acyltransferase [Brevundimonas sp.]
MPDPRFFRRLPPVALADLVGDWGEVARGGEQRISGVAPLSSAGGDDLAFLSDRKLAGRLADTAAGAVVVAPDMVERAPPSAAVAVSRFPQGLWARAASRLFAPISLDVASSVAEAVEDDSVVVEPGVVLGRGVRIGRGTRIGANSVIGPGVQIGRDCSIGSHVTLGFALVGDGVRILSGARIGEAGFGAAASPRGPIDVPQLGRVILQDHVTVGANTCIDRGAFDDTVIGEGTKIDNLVMIAHNCRIGRFCLLAGHAGLAGSVTVGDGVMFGGRAGVGDHITIGDGARIAAGAGVLADVPAGETWSGYPAKPIRQSLREAVWLAKQASGKQRGRVDTDG